MTARLAFTQASVKRAISAAKKAGLHVVGIRPDGTVLVQDGDNGRPGVSDSLPRIQTAPAPSKWEDAEA